MINCKTSLFQVVPIRTLSDYKTSDTPIHFSDFSSSQYVSGCSSHQQDALYDYVSAYLYVLLSIALAVALKVATVHCIKPLLLFHLVYNHLISVLFLIHVQIILLLSLPHHRTQFESVNLQVSLLPNKLKYVYCTFIICI